MKKKAGLVIGFIVYLFLIYLISVLERTDPNANIQSLTDALWYAIVTLTTVGYGDFYPVTPFGKIVGLFVILGSLGVIGYFIGEISSRINTYMEKKKNGFFGTDFEDHYMIIGWNSFGKKVADQIFPTGHNIAFITNSKSDLELIKDLYQHDQCFAMFADYNNMDAYKKANIEKSKAVFINFNEDTETLVFVLNLQREFPNLNIIVNCSNPDLKETLINTGIKHVVSRSEVASRLVASYLFEPHVAEYTEDLISTSIDMEDQDIQQFKVNEQNPYLGMKYFDAFVQMKKDINVILIGLVIDNKVVKNPSDDQIIDKNQYLIIISIGQSKQQLEKIFGVKEGL
ncbi:potassium channel family protein [Carboxylicivirga linearis]|uniref:Potassium channel protein n=1 Tax=Carboxylicivirga linearis TaxID=1628157 RepID=A0ABS5JQB0_9BACT|nr:potassium channel protein [Carboxylicivirga linearis]MBS2097053.1 potassium channel protein [Carboxylicivirga linearis]